MTAAIGAIALATVTVATDNDLGVTATTMVETTGSWHRQKMSMRAGFNPIVCDTQWVVHLHGVFGYGANLDRQIFGGAIPFSATPNLIAPTLDSCLFVGRSGMRLSRNNVLLS